MSDGNHRDLHVLTHSCPTRRSSDLAIAPPASPARPIAPVPGTTQVPALGPEAAPHADTAGQARLALDVKTASWVEVRQADGGIPISRVDRKSTRLTSSH